ncbi:MAG TPA: hypothetical protein VID04_04295 [Methylomirabilota bacterium]
MSVVLAGPRRTYLLMLFWRALTDGAAGRRVLSEIGARLPASGPDAGGRRTARAILCLRFHRIVWKRLIGLSLLILDKPAA